MLMQFQNIFSATPSIGKEIKTLLIIESACLKNAPKQTERSLCKDIIAYVSWELIGTMMRSDGDNFQCVHKADGPAVSLNMQSYELYNL